MTENLQKGQERPYMRVMIYCSSQEELDMLRETLPIIDGYWDAFTDIEEARKALDTGKYGIVIADFTSLNPEGRDLFLLANSWSTRIKSVCMSWRTRCDVASRIWYIGDGYCFRYRGEELDAMTVSLYSMFTETSHLKWFSHMQGEFHAMRARVARDKSQTVLLVGAAGTGKFTLSQIAHIRSPRRNNRFVFADCESNPGRPVIKWGENEKSHFAKILCTMIAEAQGGTLYFHKIDCLDIEAQEIVVDVLEKEMAINTEKSAFNGIAIFSSRRNMDECVPAHICSARLVRMLRRNIINVPSISDYHDDIELFVNDMLKNYCISQRINPKVFTKAAMEMMTTHIWSRNLREMFDVIKHAVSITKTKRIPADAIIMQPVIDSCDSRIDRERKVKQVLRECKGKKRHAAKMLEIAPKTLYEWMKKLGIPTDYK